MSAVELAVRKVKKLSNGQAEELLGWLAEHPPRKTAIKPFPKSPRRKTKNSRSTKKLIAWYDSIRGTTDWEPPRMPEELVSRKPLFQ